MNRNDVMMQLMMKLIMMDFQLDDSEGIYICHKERLSIDRMSPDNGIVAGLQIREFVIRVVYHWYDKLRK